MRNVSAGWVVIRDLSGFITRTAYSYRLYGVKPWATKSPGKSLSGLKRLPSRPSRGRCCHPPLLGTRPGCREHQTNQPAAAALQLCFGSWASTRTRTPQSMCQPRGSKDLHVWRHSGAADYVTRDAPTSKPLTRCGARLRSPSLSAAPFVRDAHPTSVALMRTDGLRALRFDLSRARDIYARR